MRGWVAIMGVICGLVGFARSSQADDRDERPKRYQAVDVQAVAYTQLLPRVTAGLDAAYVIGRRGFHARLGALLAGSPAFDIGIGRIGNVLGVGQLDLCAAKEVERHRVRVCIGGQAGAMFHRFRGFSDPGREASPWVAGTLRGDYRYAVSPRFGVMFGAGVALPAVGPQFRGEEHHGTLSPLIIPGPLAGALTLGGSFDLSARASKRTGAS